jgi:pyruvate/2-oxoglutarate dehydrogenase complex dihydrolipoamide acyltransferase (E2) component
MNTGSISLIDSLALGTRFETPIYHLSNGEVAILSLNAIVKESSEEDIIDILSGSSVPFHLNKVYSDELFDVAPLPITDVQVDLTVDPTVIPTKKAEEYLKALKELVETQPESLLK